jgi:hypothetical protein
MLWDIQPWFMLYRQNYIPIFYLSATHRSFFFIVPFRFFIYQNVHILKNAEITILLLILIFKIIFNWNKKIHESCEHLHPYAHNLHPCLYFLFLKLKNVHLNTLSSCLHIIASFSSKMKIWNLQISINPKFTKNKKISKFNWKRILRIFVKWQWVWIDFKQMQ